MKNMQNKISNAFLYVSTFLSLYIFLYIIYFYILYISIKCSSDMKLLHKTVINVSAAEFKVDYKGTSPEAGNLDSRLL